VIERLRISHFQTHKKLQILLDSRVTTLAGPSDAGKSSALRALLWLAFNTPQGDYFFNWDSDWCRVEAVIDGRVVVRKKSATTNLYKLDDDTFKAFGANVPDPVKELINLGPNNVQEQVGAPFWFYESGGQVAKELNQIVNLEVIDSTLANVGASLRQARASLGVAQERLDATNVVLARTSWVRAFADDMAAVETAERKLAEISQRAARASLSVKTIRRLTERRTGALAVQKRGSALGLVWGEWSAIHLRCQKLKASIDRLTLLQRRRGIKYPDTFAADVIVVAYSDTVERHKRLSAAIESLTDMKERQCRLKAEIKSSVSELEKLSKSARKCPICGATIKTPATRPC
jgi:hypothetical protein